VLVRYKIITTTTIIIIIIIIIVIIIVMFDLSVECSKKALVNAVTHVHGHHESSQPACCTM